jgi:hypothetical protein
MITMRMPIQDDLPLVAEYITVDKSNDGRDGCI